MRCTGCGWSLITRRHKDAQHDGTMTTTVLMSMKIRRVRELQRTRMPEMMHSMVMLIVHDFADTCDADGGP